MPLADVQSEILEPMQALFLPPRDMDQAAQTTALKAYGAVLQHFAAPDLRAAWSEVVAEHRARSWPVPGAIVQAARKAQRERTAADAPSRMRTGMDAYARWCVWQTVRTSPLALDALEAGVAWSLKCAVQDGKQPGEIALAELIRRRTSADETATAIGDRRPVPHNGRMLTFSEHNRALALKMWTNLLCNESDTAAEIRRARSFGAAPLAQGRAA